MVSSSLRRLAFKHLRIQLIATALLTLVTILFAGSLRDVYSIVLGAFACVIPTAYFGYSFTRTTGAQNAKKIVNGFYRGEIVKLFLTALIFLLIFKLIPVTIMAVFVGFITAHVAFWVSLLILRSERAVT